MWKNLFGIAAIIASCSLFVSSLPSATAQIGPMADMGSNPYRSFTGSTQISSDQTLLTLSSDEEFIVSTFIVNGSWEWCGLKADNDLIYSRSVYGHNSERTTAITMGNAHVRVPAGTTLKVAGLYPQSNSATCHYYVDGYYVRP